MAEYARIRFIDEHMKVDTRLGVYPDEFRMQFNDAGLPDEECPFVRAGHPAQPGSVFFRLHGEHEGKYLRVGPKMAQKINRLIAQAKEEETDAEDC